MLCQTHIQNAWLLLVVPQKVPNGSESSTVAELYQWGNKSYRLTQSTIDTEHNEYRWVVTHLSSELTRLFYHLTTSSASQLQSSLLLQ